MKDSESRGSIEFPPGWEDELQTNAQQQQESSLPSWILKDEMKPSVPLWKEEPTQNKAGGLEKEKGSGVEKTVLIVTIALVVGAALVEFWGRRERK